MEKDANLCSTYKPSENVVARDIEGELIIVPITSGIGDLEDELYTLNQTGRAIWEKLDGKNTLADIAKKLSTQFVAPLGKIEKDVLGIVEELLKRRILIQA